MTAAATVLAIPELLMCILSNASAPKDLSRAARISRLWFEAAIPVLWHGEFSYKSIWRSPDFDVLLRIAKRSDARFQRYLYHIQILNLIIPHRSRELWHVLDQDVLMWRSFRGKGLRIYWRHSNHRNFQARLDQHLQALVRPSLRVISIGNGRLSHELLASIQHRCSGLQALLQTGDHMRYNLRQVEKMSYSKDLVYLELNCNITDEQDNRMSPTLFQASAYEFHRLQNLVINLGSSLNMLPKLLSRMPRLSSLSVEGQYTGQPDLDSILGSIALLHATLRHLYIGICSDGEDLSRLEHTIVAASASCVRLVSLKLNTRLHEQFAHMRGSLSLTKIRNMARNLPLMEKLIIKCIPADDMYPMIDLLQLLHSLPKLQVIDIEPFVVDIETPLDAADAMLLETALPALQSLRVSLALDADLFLDIHERLCADWVSDQNSVLVDIDSAREHITNRTVCRAYVRSKFAFIFSQTDVCYLLFSEEDLQTMDVITEIGSTISLPMGDKIQVDCALEKSTYRPETFQDIPNEPGINQGLVVSKALGFDRIV